MSVVSRLDGYQRRHRWLGLPIAVVYKFVDDLGGYLAALITYYGFLSLFPLLLIFSTVLGFLLPANPQLQQQLIDSALSQFPIIGDQLTSSAQPLRGSGAGFGDRDPGRALRRPRRGGGDPERAEPGVGRTGEQAAGSPPGAAAQPAAAGAVRHRRAAHDRVVGARHVESATRPGRASRGHRPVDIANSGLFVLAFRTLTARNVSVRDVLPGAVMAAIGWQVLQSVGTIYVDYQLRGSSQVYGLFGIVLGLLAWIYLEALIIVLAAEVNVVLVRRLWPRALLTPVKEDVDLTHADRRSYESYVNAQQFREAEKITVEFETQPEQPKGDDTTPT